MVELETARGLEVRWGGLVLVVIAMTVSVSCARVAASGQRTAGDPDALAGADADRGESTIPYTGKLELDESPWATERALAEIPFIKHALTRSATTRPATAEPEIRPRPGELAPNPFAEELKRRADRRPEDDAGSATIAVRQLMMKEADADRATDLSAAPEPDFRGQGRQKKSAASSASNDVELDVIGYLARQHAKIKTCYEMGLAVDPSIEGKITVKFKVNRRGKVRRARVMHSELPRSVERCILHTLKKLDFPDQEDPSVVFEYPFIFGR